MINRTPSVQCTMVTHYVKPILEKKYFRSGDMGMKGSKKVLWDKSNDGRFKKNKRNKVICDDQWLTDIKSGKLSFLR